MTTTVAQWERDNQREVVTLYGTGRVALHYDGYRVPQEKHGLGFTRRFVTEQPQERLVDIIAAALGPRYNRKDAS